MHLFHRPTWSPNHWSHLGISSRSWPPPKHGAKNLDPTPIPRSEHDIDLNNPGRFVQNLQHDWPDVDAFSLSQLIDNYGDQELSVGIDDDTGDDVTLSLSKYLDYAYRDADGDDAPLYVFDDWILGNDADCPLRNAYQIPPCFKHDYMAEISMLSGERNGNEEEEEIDRPPFCWLLIGAARSGTALHIDPTSTAAWNTLVSGKKRWFIFPPSDSNSDNDMSFGQGENTVSTESIKKEGKLDDIDDGSCTDSVSHWIHESYKCMSSPPTTANSKRMFDFVQLPGETVYIPCGWRHAVVNLELSVAVTHNFVGPHNVVQALRSMHRSDPDIASRWEDQLREKGYYVDISDTLNSS